MSNRLIVENQETTTREPLLVWQKPEIYTMDTPNETHTGSNVGPDGGTVES